MSTQDRVRWVDLAKGLTMVLIVLAHTLGKHYVELGWSIDVPVRRGWMELSELFGPMRMPLFLMISGLLASSSLRRARGDAIMRRVVNPYLLYVLWFTINVVFLAAFRFTEPEQLELTTTGVLTNLVLPHTTLWYMFALAVFFAGALLLRPLGVVVPLAGAALLSLAAHAGWLALPAGSGMAGSLLRYFLLFLIGAFLPGFPRRIAVLRGAVPLVVAILAYGGVTVALRMGAGDVPGFAPLATVIGAAVGVVVAVRLTSVRHLAPALEAIGRRTLPIFVLHVPFLAVLHWLALGPAAKGWEPLLASPLAAAAYPGVVTVAGVGACLAVSSLLERAGVGWLFALPIGKRSALPGASPIPVVSNAPA